MSYKNDSPNLTQKVQWFIKGLVVNLSIFSYFSSMEGHRRLSRLFFGDLPDMLYVANESFFEE